MKHPYLNPRKSGNKTYFHFRSKIPIDLIPTFSGRKEFQISLKNVSNKETLLVSVSLQTLTEQLFNDIRKGMKTLTLEDVREILKVEVRKSILHSHHVHLETNKYDSEKIIVELISSLSTLLFYYCGDVLQECGEYTWRVSDCEELVGVNHRR